MRAHSYVGAASGRQQVAPVIPNAPRRRDEHLCPSWVVLVRFAKQTIVCVSGRSSRVRCIAPVASSRPGRICLAANCVRTERRSDVGILRDSSSSHPTRKRAGRLPALRVTRTAGCRPYGRVRAYCLMPNPYCLTLLFSRHNSLTFPPKCGIIRIQKIMPHLWRIFYGI